MTDLPYFFYSFSALVDSSASEIAVEDNCKITNMRDKEWITQTPWRTILSERYPPMREVLEKTESQGGNSYLSNTFILIRLIFVAPSAK